MIRILIFLLLLTTIANCQEKDLREIFEFQFEGNTINGVLNLPSLAPPKGIVLLIHGSGRTNAIQEELHLDVRAAINHTGYATYMWDKMGCGKSEGVFDANQPVQNSALEVITAIKALQDKKIPGSHSIGLWGISRAGWIIPIVINTYEDIKFWISVSGVDDKENFGYLFQENLRINGYSEDSTLLLVNELKEGNRICHAGGDYPTYLAATENLRNNSFLKRFNNNFVITEEGYYAFQKTFMQEAFDKEAGLQIYIQDFSIILTNVDCPVLALFGERDKNVDWQKTKSLYQATMGKHIDLTIQSFPDGNHNLFQCKTGGFYEFQDNNLPWVRCEGFLEAIIEWLNKKG